MKMMFLKNLIIGQVGWLAQVDPNSIKMNTASAVIECQTGLECHFDWNTTFLPKMTLFQGKIWQNSNSAPPWSSKKWIKHQRSITAGMVKYIFSNFKVNLNLHFLLNFQNKQEKTDLSKRVWSRLWMIDFHSNIIR